jgi:hypothetical protein
MGKEDEILKKELFAFADLAGGGELVDFSSGSGSGVSLDELCCQIRRTLASDHVRCREPEASFLQSALRDTGSSARAVLAQGFHTLLTIEASQGLGVDDRFDYQARFLPYLREVLFAAFGVEATDYFHPEQVPQVLKDEEPSLFCFLDARFIPEPEIQRLRGFTQGRHRVLLCGHPPVVRTDAVEHLKLQLVVVKGKPDGYVIPIPGPSFRIGRGETCHLRPSSTLVSREHAVLTVEEGLVRVRDLGSDGGTFVNGKRLTPGSHLLKDQDLLQIGPLTFAIVIRGRTAVPPSSKPDTIDDVDSYDIESWLRSESVAPDKAFEGYNMMTPLPFPPLEDYLLPLTPEMEKPTSDTRTH